MARSVQGLRTKTHDAGASGQFTKAMEVSCPECGHGLWTERVPVGDRYRAWTCFDDEEGSNTYAEQVLRCPGCAAGLNAEVLEERERARLS
jgi:hypothetical protein